MPGIYSSAGLRYLLNLGIGVDELQWLQAENVELRRRTVRALTRNFGLVVSNKTNGEYDSQWSVDDAPAGTDGVLYLTTSTEIGQPGQGPDEAILVTEDGDVVGFDGADGDAIPGVIVPDDATWYTLVVTASSTYAAPGTVALTAATGNMVGTNTDFRRFLGATDGTTGRGTRITISGSALGNNGDYTIDTVTDALNATITPNAVANESGLIVTPIGTFIGTAPVGQEIHERMVLVFSLVARTREPAAGYFVVADVKREVGVHAIDIIDRRERNIWRPSVGGEHHYISVSAAMGYDRSLSTWWAIEDAIGVGVNGQTSVTTSKGIGLLAAVQVGANSEIYEYDAASSVWQNPGGGGLVTLAASDYCAILEVPAASGATHLGFYVTGQALYVARSTDAGQTFAAGALIWDPTAVNPANYVEYPAVILLKNHRIYVLAGYYANLTTKLSVRYIYSDDYGATWSTNANGGFAWMEPAIGMVLLDVTQPTIWQSDSGRIETAWQEENVAGDLTIRHTASDRAYELHHASAPGRGHAIAAHGYDQSNPAIYADDDGGSIIFYTEHLGGAPAQFDFRVASVADATIYDDFLVGISAVGGSTWSVCQLGGFLYHARNSAVATYFSRMTISRNQRNHVRC